MLVYSDTPGKFRLEGQGDTFTVSPVTVDQSNGLGPPVGWQLPTGDDLSQVGLDANLIFCHHRRDMYRSRLPAPRLQERFGSFLDDAQKNEVTRFLQESHPVSCDVVL